MISANTNIRILNCVMRRISHVRGSKTLPDRCGGGKALRIWETGIPVFAWLLQMASSLLGRALENFDFIQWMETAALPNFKKLYRRLLQQPGDLFYSGLPTGDYTLTVKYSESPQKSWPTWIFFQITTWACGEEGSCLLSRQMDL